MPIQAVTLSPQRAASDLSKLCAEEFDVLVIGGGIVGVGAALDAASRGLRVAIVEAQDWASGTSSRSSKLIHGGLRYLKMHDFALVREALRERSVLLRNAPHLVHPIPFLLPLRRRIVDRAYIGAGVVLYDFLARGGNHVVAVPNHRQLSRRRALSLAPALNEDALIGAIQFWDGQVDDARHTLAVLRTAASYGAVVASRVCVVGLLREGERIVGVRLVRTETGHELVARAKVVVSATGVWTEQFEALAGTDHGLRVQPSKGVHLVVPRSSIASSTALILPTDRSVLFVLPWGEHWIVGTTDTTWAYDLARPAATLADVEYLLSTLNSVLAVPLSRSDVESVYVGLRPLIAGAGAETTKTSREHAVNRPLPGLVLVSGGKYTTYRVMAKDVIDAALEHVGLRAGPCRTEEISLVGADGFTQVREDRHELAATSGLDTGQVDRLLGRYGSLVVELLAETKSDSSLLRPLGKATGYLRGEVAYAVTHEDARHLEDVLTRRTRLAMETRDRGCDVADEVAEIMSSRLGWDAATASEEVAAYRALVSVEKAAEAEWEDEDADARILEASPFLLLP